MAVDDDDEKDHGFRFLYIHSSKWRLLFQALVCLGGLGLLATLKQTPLSQSPVLELATTSLVPRAFLAQSTSTTTEPQAKQEPRLVPLRLEMKLSGSFAEQRMQLLSGLLAGLLLGAQVILPELDSKMQLGDLFDVQRLRRNVRKAYTKYWCVRRKYTAHEVWCSSTLVPALLRRETLQQLEAEEEISLESLQLNWTTEELPRLGDKIWRRLCPKGAQVENLRVTNTVLVNLAPGFYSQVRAVEPEISWRFLSYLSDALTFSDPVLEAFETMKRNIFVEFVARAAEKAKSLGYRPMEDASFGVLEVEPSCHSEEVCVDIGNVLLSEGVAPSTPLYIYGTRKSQPILNTVYTVITKDMIFEKDLEDHLLEAVHFLLAKDAALFVGPSSSMSSSMMFLLRRNLGSPSFHYDGQRTMLESKLILKPEKSSEVDIFRTPLKWVFTLTSRETMSTAWNQSLAAVRSLNALSDLVIPVCITDAQPSNRMVHLLLELGVRVLHHRPSWLGTLKTLSASWKQKAEKKWKFIFNDFEDMLGSFLRIDIPVVGLLDPLVLYSDTDILFRQHLTWELLLDTNDLSSVDLESYARPGRTGLPEFLGLAGESVRSNNPLKADTGVMLMNLRNLRQTYSNFSIFLFNRQQPWQFSTGDPCNYRSFYQSKGKLLISAIPGTMNWKPYWENNPQAVIVHFHGPKCDPDIEKQIYEGTTRFEPFRGLLEKCAGHNACQKLCRDYELHLSSAYEHMPRRNRWDTAP